MNNVHESEHISSIYNVRYALGVVLIVGAVLQFFRYEYVFVPQAGVLRIDRLTGRACLSFPKESTQYASPGCR